MSKALKDRILEPDTEKSAIDQILEGIDGQGDSAKTFRVVVPKYPPLHFRYPKSCGDSRAFTVHGIEFVGRMQEGMKQRHLPKPYLDAFDVRKLDDEDLATAWCIHYWSADESRISEAAALTLVAKRVALAVDIQDSIERGIRRGTMVLAFGGVAEKKDNSKPTPSKDSDSKPADDTSQANTQTP